MTERGSSFPSYGSVDPAQVAVVKPGFNVKEFTNICENITSKIYQIQNSASNLSNVLRQIETNFYTVALRDRIHDIQQKTNPIINLTTQNLQQVSVMSRSGNKQQKLQVDRLRNKFQETIQYYSSLQKQIAEKIKSVVLRTNQSENMSPTTDWDENDKSCLLENEANKRELQKQRTSEIQTDHELVIEREQRIRQIESDLIDVNEILRDLATMVKDQSEVVDTLENHVEATCSNVEQGTAQLQKAATYQKKYRKKICCLLLLLLVVAVIITIIILATR